MHIQTWTRFVKYLRFTSAVASLEQEQFTEYIAHKFLEFSERLIANQLFGELLDETVDTNNSVPETVLDWIQCRASWTMTATYRC